MGLDYKILLKSSP